MIKIVWWESCITEHQIYTLIELSNMPGVEVTVFSTSMENEVRKKQGWHECDWSLIDMSLIPFPGVGFILNAMQRKDESIHIFGGPFDSWKITAALFLSLFFRNRTYILTEPYCPISSSLLDNGNRFKNMLLPMLRPIKFRLLWTVLRARLEGVFAISHLAIDQLLSFGVSSEKIFPYGYFVPPMQENLNFTNLELKRHSADKDLRLIFVGSLNHIKGIDLLVNAVNKLRNIGVRVTLDVFGPASRLKDYCWSSCVRYRGVIPFGEAQSIMATYDFLVLPSRYDGWGVVVNEALLSGTPIICSDKVGAASLVQKWGCGAVYDSSAVSSLEGCISKIYHDKEKVLEAYRKSLDQVCQVITPKCGAHYICECIDGKWPKGLGEESSWYSQVTTKFLKGNGQH